MPSLIFYVFLLILKAVKIKALCGSLEAPGALGSGPADQQSVQPPSCQNWEHSPAGPAPPPLLPRL